MFLYNAEYCIFSRKKLRGDIIQQFPQLTEEELNVILPSKDTVFQLKVLAHTGEVVVIYSVQKLPIVFEIEKVMYPTVYMLWHKPDLLYTFTTHPQVLPVIGRGADLMLPGVVLPPNNEGLHAYGHLKKGERVAVNLTKNKAPVAVGKAANSSYDMYMCAKRGKCVEVLHYYGDLLSTYGTKLVVPELGPAFDVDMDSSSDDMDSPTEDHNNEHDLDDSLANITEKLELKSVGIENTEGKVTELSSNEKELNDSDPTNYEPEETIMKSEHPEDSRNSTMSMDDLLKYCFLKSIRTTMKKVDLPLLTSNFYKLHMIPACPEGQSLDIKKSSYKKLSNFLDEMAKLGVVQLESLQKGVQSISKIDYTNELVKSFVDKLTNEKDDAGLKVDNSVTNKASVPEITEKYVVTAAVLPLFYPYDYK